MFINWSSFICLILPTRLLMLCKWRSYPASLYSMPPCPYAGHGIGAKWITVFWFIEEPPLARASTEMSEPWEPREFEIICSTCNNKDDLSIFFCKHHKLLILGPVADLVIFLQQADSVRCKELPISPGKWVSKELPAGSRGLPEMMDAGITYKCFHSSSPHGN